MKALPSEWDPSAWPWQKVVASECGKPDPVVATVDVENQQMFGSTLTWFTE